MAHTDDTYEQIAADFTAASSREPAWLRIYQVANGRRNDTLWEGPVSGKREARQVATQFNATPWNF